MVSAKKPDLVPPTRMHTRGCLVEPRKCFAIVGPLRLVAKAHEARQMAPAFMSFGQSPGLFKWELERRNSISRLSIVKQ